MNAVPTRSAGAAPSASKQQKIFFCGKEEAGYEKGLKCILHLWSKRSGERKEFFEAEKNLDELAVKVARERSKREIKPALKVLKEVSSIEAYKTEEEKHFIEQTNKLYEFVLKADNVLDKITEYKDNWLAKLVVKIMKK